MEVIPRNDNTMVKHPISGDQIPEDIIRTVIALEVKRIMVD
jgi:hypothetical protein